MTIQHAIHTAMNSMAELRKFMADQILVEQTVSATSFLPEKCPIKQRFWHIIRNTYSMPLCECGQILKWNPKSASYRRFCCSKCAHNNQSVKLAIAQTCIERYGETTYLKTSTAQTNYKAVMIERYGVDNPFKSAQVQQQIKSTLSQQYGVDNITQLPWVRDKITETHRQRYRRDRYSQLHLPQDVCDLKKNREYLADQYAGGKSVYDIALELGIGYSQLCVKFNQLGIPLRESSGQIELMSYLKEIYNGPVELNAKIFDNKQEIDVYLPELKIGFEYNGIFWHAENSSGKKDYHRAKTESAKTRGVKLFHIIDIEWKTKKHICKSRIASLIGNSTRLHARKTQIQTLTAAQASEFFNQNHIQGSASACLYLGLVMQDKIVAAMSFGKSRFNNYQYELIRFCNLAGFCVTGAASKLFKHGVKQLSAESVVSFCDLRWGTGNVYSVLGFSHVRNNNPSYMYTHEYKTLENRMKFQKHKLEKLLPVFDKNLSEWENMKANKYDRIWDCGNSVWVWHKHVNDRTLVI